MIFIPFKRSELSKEILDKIKFIEKESELLLKYWDKNPTNNAEHKAELLILEYMEMINIIDSLHDIPKEESPSIMLDSIIHFYVNRYSQIPITYESVLDKFYDNMVD